MTTDTLPEDTETETGPELYRDADGVPLNDLYHVDGVVRVDLPDGCYIGMPEYVYFAQDRLGSSDLKILSTDEPEDWFYGSRHNEFREEATDKEDMLVGRALHAYMLEGATAFEERYKQKPATYHDEKSGKDKKWNANSNVCKAWVKEQENLGVTVMDSKSYRNVYRMGELIKNHPEMGPYLSGGLSEVTVLVTIGGLRCRARFDKLLMKFIVDLKSQGKHKVSTASPAYLRELGITRDQHTALLIIRNMRYYIQRYLYSIARKEMRGMVKAGMVHGASPGQMKWLKDLAEVETWDFVFLFYRKINNSSRNPAAPIVTPLISNAGDLIDQRGWEKFDLGAQQYQALVDRFGFGVAWARINSAVSMPEKVLMDVMGPSHEAKPEYRHEVDETDGQDIEWDDEDEEGDGQA